MDEQKKIYRIFQLIARLRTPLGCSKSDIAEDFEVNVRTVERYFKLLRDLGFEIERVKHRYRIPKIDKGGLSPEDLIVFNLEEAACIREALLQSKVDGIVQKGLLDKLYALTDLEELSDTISKLGTSRNISDLRYAIKNKFQVRLKGYHSVNSEQISDRLVEPIRFHNYYRYLLAYEHDSDMIKQYKTERITSVELTAVPYRFEHKHEQMKIDIFGMSGIKPIQVRLYLSRRARQLLEEEFPGATRYLGTRMRMDCFEGPVFSLEGVGRFVLGLADEIEVSAPRELKEYVKAKLQRALQNA